MNLSYYTFESGGATHAGLVRTDNEDDFLVSPESGIWLVADGMGGHDTGEFASGKIVEMVRSVGKPASAPDLKARFEDRLHRANREIVEVSRARGGTMGSTIAAILIYERQYACLWSGDSRVYMLRGSHFERISRDHSEVQELIDRGVIAEAEAETYPRRNVITRAIGIADEVSSMIEDRFGFIEPEDAFLLCSDGLTAHVKDREIEEVLRDSDPQDACDKLLEMTMDRGATDNVTVVVVKCHDGGRTVVPDL